MAKTIMISNEIYEELKRRKGDDSFSNTIRDLMNGKEKKKTMKVLFENCYGILEGDTEYDEVAKELKKGWKEFDERIRKNMEEESA